MCSRMRAIDLRRVWALHAVTWRYLASIADSFFDIVYVTSLKASIQ